MLPLISSRRHFRDLSEREILALAISNEEDDSRIYATYAGRLRQSYPGTAAVFDEMVEEEAQHRRRLIDEYERRFDGPIPLIRREHVAGYFARRPVWLVENLDIDQIRGEAARMERTAGDFYDKAAKRSSDPVTRKLLGDLALAERGHEKAAQRGRRAPRARRRRPTSSAPRATASSC